MSATTIVAPEQTAGSVARRLPWAPIAFFGVLLLAGYLPVLSGLVKVWSGDEDMSHGFIVVPVALYIVWVKREEWLNLPAKWNWLGVLVMLWGTSQLVVASLGVEFFLARTALLITIAGALLFVGSWQLLRVFVFPLIVLAFMIPIPAIIYSQLTFPLQMFASQVAEKAMDFLNVPVYREGNILELPNGEKLSVVEACSGIRSLLSLSFLSLAYGFLSERRTWVRWVLFLMTIPIAVATNAGRVTATGLISESNPDLAKGFFHEMEGMVSWAVAMVLLIGFHYLLTRVFRAEESHANA